MPALLYVIETEVGIRISFMFCSFRLCKQSNDFMTFSPVCH